MTFDQIPTSLKSVLRHNRGIEAMAFWAGDAGWTDATGEPLEHEEILFYAEGLLIEGAQMAWQVIGQDDVADHLRLFFWQAGARPALPPPPHGLALLDEGSSEKG